MSQLLQKLDRGAENILKTLQRFPWVSISAYLMTLILIVFSIQGHGVIEKYPNYLIADKIAYTATLAIPLFFLFRLISPSRLLSLLGVGLMVGHVMIIPDNFEQNQEIMFQHSMIVLATSILIFVAPFIFKSVKNRNLWEWIQQLLFGLFLTAIVSIILYLGTKGILYAFRELFHLNLPVSKYREDGIIMLTLFGTFSINYFISQIPKEPEQISFRAYTKVETIFSKYILAPLTGIYFLILFAYTFKIIFFTELPSGVMSKLVIIFSAVAILTLLFWIPLWNEKNKKYKRLLWLAIIIQTSILAFSLYLRIDQYGVTEKRYFLALIGIWLFAISLYYIIRKDASYKWIFISLSTLILLSQMESSLSAKNLSKNSQIAQLKTLLGNNPNLTEESNRTIKYQISSKIEYLFRKHKLDSLLPVIPKIVTEYQLLDNNISDCEVVNYRNFPQYATQRLGFTFINQWEWEENQFEHKSEMPIFIRSNNMEVLNVEGYEWLQEFSFQGGEELFCPPTSPHDTLLNKKTYTIKTDKKSLIIKKESEIIATIKIDDFLEKIKKSWEEQSEHKDTNLRPFMEHLLKKEKLTFHYNNKKVEIKIIFQVVSFSPKVDKIEHYDGKILIHEK